MIKMDDNFLFNFSIPEKEEEVFSNSREDILRYLSDIGVDTRYISLSDNRIYINNLRFSKFSRRREEIFNRHYKDIEVIRSGLFQEIATNASRELAHNIRPKSRILIPADANPLIEIILEPYTRKYGVELVHDEDDDYDLITSNRTLDTEVHSIIDEIFGGDGISFPRKDMNYIYPLIKTTNLQINKFLSNNDLPTEFDDLAGDFLKFLDETVVQYKPNILASTEFLEEHMKK